MYIKITEQYINITTAGSTRSQKQTSNPRSTQMKLLDYDVQNFCTLQTTGNVLREQLVNLYSKTTMFKITNATFCPQSVLICFYGSQRKQLSFSYAALTAWFS